MSGGKKPSCGCLKYSGFKKHKSETEVDLIGKRFENLLVVDSGPIILTGKDKKRRRTWKCKCDCGQTIFVTTGDLVSGNTKSCGCLVSVGQKRVAELLSARHVDFVSEYSFPDLLSDKGYPLRFDFAVFRDGILSFLLEYQGEQHYIKRNVWFGRQQREKTDKQKKRYCKDHNIPLYEIAYDEDISDKLSLILKLAHDNTVPSSGNSEKV